MANDWITFRKFTIRLAVVSGLIIGVPTIAVAAMAVVDATAITKLTQQINNMKEQLQAALDQITWLQEISAVANDTLNAVGTAGAITLPTVNLERLTGRLNSDVGCLINNLNDAYPTLGFENLNFASICAGRTAYSKALFIKGAEVEDDERPLTWRERSEEVKAVNYRRHAVSKEAVVSGLALAKLNTTDVPETNGRAVQELQNSVLAAKDQNSRLAVIAQGIVLQAQLQVQSNQLQAKQVELLSSLLMGMSLPATDNIEITEKEEIEGNN